MYFFPRQSFYSFSLLSLDISRVNHRRWIKIGRFIGETHYLRHKEPEANTSAWFPPALSLIYSPNSSMNKQNGANRVVLILVHKLHIDSLIKIYLMLCQFERNFHKNSRPKRFSITIILIFFFCVGAFSISLCLRHWSEADEHTGRSFHGGSSRATEAAASIPLDVKVRGELSIRTRASPVYRILSRSPGIFQVPLLASRTFVSFRSSNASGPLSP